MRKRVSPNKALCRITGTSIKILLLSKQPARHTVPAFAAAFLLKHKSKTRELMSPCTETSPRRPNRSTSGMWQLCSSLQQLSFYRPDCLSSLPSCFLLIAAAFFTPSISISPCHALHHPNLPYLPPSFLPLLCEADEMWAPRYNPAPLCWRRSLPASPQQRKAKNLNSLHSQGCYCASVHTRVSVWHFLSAKFHIFG